MIIRKKRIQDLDSNIGFLKRGTRLAVGVRDLPNFADALKRAGFKTLVVGETVLPSPRFGPVSQFNAEGTNVVHRDRRMETAYRTVEWSWTEWHGRDRVERTDFRDVPYKRYPRTFLAPPSVELSVAKSQGGDLIVVSPVMSYVPQQEERLKHAINLVLEIFGECQLFTEELQQILKLPIQRVNWDILPPGERPWEKLKKELQPIIKEARKGNRPVIEHRLETINSHGPAFTAVGRAGFRGYIVLGFPSKNLFVLESLFYGNATYLFDRDWENLSKMTKAEVLAGDLQRDRIIHREGWDSQIRRVFRNNRPRRTDKEKTKRRQREDKEKTKR